MHFLYNMSKFIRKTKMNNIKDKKRHFKQIINEYDNLLMLREMARKFYENVGSKDEPVEPSYLHFASEYDKVKAIFMDLKLNNKI